MSDLISRQDAVSRISDLLMIELQGKHLPTWNEVYNAINDIPCAEPKQKIGKCTKTNCPFQINISNDCDIKTCPYRTEQKKGKWQRRKGSDCWECSQCHAVLENDDLGMHNFYFCYHCGANMMNKNGYMDIEEVHYE